MKAGFLLGGNQKKKPAATKPVAAAAASRTPVIEDHTYVKAADPTENLRFDEVQNNLKTGLERTKDEWLTPDFM